MLMNNTEFTLLRNEQRHLDDRVSRLTERLLELQKNQNEMIETIDKRLQFIRGTIQSHIDSRVAHSADLDQFDSMLDMVQEGKASMTVSYSLYPIEKEEPDNA